MLDINSSEYPNVVFINSISLVIVVLKHNVSSVQIAIGIPWLINYFTGWQSGCIFVVNKLDEKHTSMRILRFFILLSCSSVKYIKCPILSG